MTFLDKIVWGIVGVGISIALLLGFGLMIGMLSCFGVPVLLAILIIVSL